LLGKHIFFPNVYRMRRYRTRRQYVMLTHLEDDLCKHHIFCQDEDTIMRKIYDAPGRINQKLIIESMLTEFRFLVDPQVIRCWHREKNQIKVASCCGWWQACWILHQYLELYAPKILSLIPRKGILHWLFDVSVFHGWVRIFFFFFFLVPGGFYLSWVPGRHIPGGHCHISVSEVLWIFVHPTMRLA
jgi:hypothetical protein